MTIEKKPMEESTEQNHVREVEEDESLTEEFEEEEDDSDQDPTFDILEETRSGFSNLSLKKSKSRITKAIDRGSQEEEEGSDDVEVEVKLPELDAKDLKSFENVEKLIAGGQLGKLKVEQCKVYLRKNGLRLTGNKDVLIDRIKEHLGIVNGGGEQKYPASSFVLNCKGDACTGDVVMFEQNVYEMYSIASRSATGPPCGTRIVAGRIVKESYGSAKQQHTFTIEVLWSKGVKPLPALHPLLIKGRNLYRLKTLRQLWADEEERRKVLLEKHSRGFVARSNRETRIQEKETRKMLKGQRVTKNKSNVIQDQKKRIQPDPFRTNMSSPQVVQPQKQQKFIDPVIYRTQPQLHPNLIKSENPTILKPNSVIHQNSNVTEQQHNIRKCENLQNGGFQLARNTQNHFSGEVHQSYDVNVNVTEQHHHNGVREVGNHRSNGFHVASSHFSEKAHHSYDANGSSFNSFPRSPTHGKAPMQWQVCRYYAQGRCHHGENCKYLHEDRGKPVNDERICMSPTRGRAPMQRQVCQYYAQGRCHHGENCKYLHEDRGKPVNDESICMSPTRGRAPMLRQVCQYYAKGRCLYGENCKYLHEVRKERVNDERITAKQSNLGSPPWSPTRRSFNSPTRGSLHSPTHRSINSPPWSPNHGRYPMQQPVRYNAQGGRYMHERR